MRNASLIAACVLAIATLAACNDSQGAIQEHDQAAAAAAAEAVNTALAQRDEEATKVHADPGPAVYFVNLREGQVVASPFRVVFGVHGMGIAPALMAKEYTGHHHLLIDTELSAEEMQFAIPNDAQHMHFGGGQSETVLQLPAGPHTLQLVFGDLNHELHKPAPLMSRKISITVK